MDRVHQVVESTNDRARYRTWRWHEPVGYVFPEQWQRVARDHQLKGQEFRLLLGLLAHVQWGNTCACTLAQVSKEVGLALSTVSRVARVLVAARWLCIEPTGHAGQRYVLHLSPLLVWRGRPWLRSTAYAQYRARWRFCHGALHGPDASEEASTPPEGTSEEGTPPSPPWYPLMEVRSVGDE